MITINDVILDCVINFGFVLFAFLIFKNNKFAWIPACVAIALQIYLGSKYSTLSSFVYLWLHLCVVVVGAIVFFKNTKYSRIKFKKIIISLSTALSVIIVWVLLMYKYINPAIINTDVLFGFGYLIYMLFAIGCVLLCYRIHYGLIFLATVFMSKALEYASAANAAFKSPSYSHDFMLYYCISAVFLLAAGLFAVTTYTKINRLLRSKS